MTLIEKYTDNGEFSHYELVNSEHDVVWAGQENETYYYFDKYIQNFAEKMMELSNRLIESDNYGIKEDYLEDIQEFIHKTTGL